MTDSEYLNMFLAPVRQCEHYVPKFGAIGQTAGVSLQDFREMYGSDLFYAWIGLNSDLMYAAHKAAGGMTSVYRQVGLGCERLFRQILADTAGYQDLRAASWSYTTRTPSGRTKTLTLDGRLGIGDIAVPDVEDRTLSWLKEYCGQLDIPEIPRNGAVFEVRQGYKSKDSKRQNADIDNATVAWSHGYLPVIAVFSRQIDSDIVLRYRNSRCGILTGTVGNGPYESLYDFMAEVIGYDLAGFFQRNRDAIHTEIERILEALLRPE